LQVGGILVVCGCRFPGRHRLISDFPPRPRPRRGRDVNSRHGAASPLMRSVLRPIRGAPTERRPAAREGHAGHSYVAVSEAKVWLRFVWAGARVKRMRPQRVCARDL
jgi:hypothetical protein